MDGLSRYPLEQQQTCALYCPMLSYEQWSCGRATALCWLPGVAPARREAGGERLALFPGLLPLLVLSSVALTLHTQPPFPDRANCTSRYEGIWYCVQDDGDIHLVIIDLHNPYIRFETVMADDVTSVNTDHRERVEDMVTRPPYADQPVVVAVNADYFGHTHGPEGLTVKNGQRLDGPGLSNPNALWRSSLAISRLNRVSLGRKDAADLTDPLAFREHFYTAVGGAPLILSYGVVIPNTIACPMERFPVGACRRKIQTVAGLSRDGRWLYLAAGQGRDVEGFARLLRDYGAFTAIKLDGGGSSQLWYDGRMRHDSDRPVANALFVFYSPVPRHDLRWETSPPPLIVPRPPERFPPPASSSPPAHPPLSTSASPTPAFWIGTRRWATT